MREGLVRVTRRLPKHGGRELHPEDLHITLVFLGLVEPERYSCVEDVADRINAEPFGLAMDRVGYWKRPRILWCGSSQTPPALERLVRDLQHGLEDCGSQPEKRPYSAHITLARKARPVRGYDLDEPLRWPVHEFALIASHPGQTPPHYQVLKKWSLGS